MDDPSDIDTAEVDTRNPTLKSAGADRDEIDKIPIQCRGHRVHIIEAQRLHLFKVYVCNRG
jgi:hypothetical protein